MKNFAQIIFMAIIIFTAAIPRPTEAKNSNGGVIAVGLCAAMIGGIAGWAWWNDYIQLPGEERAAEIAEAGSPKLNMRVTTEWSFGIARFSVEGSTLDAVEVVEKPFNWGATLDLKSSSGEILARGKKVIGAWVSTIEIVDSNGNSIGTLQKDWAETFGSFGTVYSILNSNGNSVASSERIQSFTREFTLKSTDGQIVATVDGEFGSFPSAWNIHVYDTELVDQRVLILLPAFQELTGK